MHVFVYIHIYMYIYVHKSYEVFFKPVLPMLVHAVSYIYTYVVGTRCVVYIHICRGDPLCDLNRRDELNYKRHNGSPLDPH